MKQNTRATGSPVQRAFLVAAQTRSQPSQWLMEDSLKELEQLAHTAGLEVVGQAQQHMRSINPASYIGKGKVEELGLLKRELDYDVVVFDDELSPGQLRNLEDTLEVVVLDRTALILDIFAKHARTKEGALQVALAQYEYRLPRLTKQWSHLSRQGVGGVGLRGPGETQLETDRRDIGRRISQLKSELEQVRIHRSLYRNRRKRAGIPVVAIVGYTNAGKSTLLNQLSGANVLVEDKLFATLDPTTRRIALPSGREVLITDTVGFIQKLPTQLVAAFRATLEEVTEAELLLHIVDITHPNVQQQMSTVEQLLTDLGASDKAMIVALNKIDKLPDPDLAQEVTQSYPHSVAISALRGMGTEELLEGIEQALIKQMAQITALIPYGSGELVSLFHRQGVVESEKYQEGGTLVTGMIPVWHVAAFDRYLQ
ncbi:MAG: GTPase HflX [Anaerolineae bacterium]|nr:GTPase HflX [Anaerolineae bacterium]